jgi:hypothetical protein
MKYNGRVFNVMAIDEVFSHLAGVFFGFLVYGTFSGICSVAVFCSFFLLFFFENPFVVFLRRGIGKPSMFYKC